MSVFRAVWPITGTAVPLRDLLDEAVEDLPYVAARARARLTAPGRFIVAPSAIVPGSGHVTEYALVYEGPAVGISRDYHKGAA